MAIDDLAGRIHDCDLLLDQNLCENFDTRYEGLTPAHCRKLLGPRYALLRPEFEQERQRLRGRNGSVRRILIFFGGSDSTNETAKALEAMRLLNRPEIAVDVVVGGGNPHKDRVKVLCGALPNARFYCQVANMAELMANADLAIGAGGSTTWERFCLELPSLVVAVAPNQEPVAEKAAAEGRLLYLGKSDEVTAESISQAVGTLLQAHGWLNFLAKSSSELVDGRGVERVVRCLIDRETSLRRAELGDCGNVYTWRNAEETRRHSFGSDPIFRGEHDQWFAATLANPGQVLLIGEYQGDAVGVLRYDLKGEDAMVSVYLVPGKHGYGYGPDLLRAGCKWLRKNQTGIRSVVAEVLTANQASVKAFLEAGFEHHISVYRKNLDE
jgi:spore coat polysaccharide biosynthesis predicted glycosyltransferase SpsG/RimJ/RimL family protein N-acetyltransferase